MGVGWRGWRPGSAKAMGSMASARETDETRSSAGSKRDVAAGGDGGLSIRLQHPWAAPLRLVLVAVGAVVGLWLIVTLRGVIVEFLIAVIFATGLTPPVNWLQRHGLPRILSLVLIYLAFVLLLAGLLFLVMPAALDALSYFVAYLPELASRLLQRYQDLRQQAQFLPPLTSQFSSSVQGLGDQLSTLAQRALQLAQYALTVAGVVLAVIFVLLITFYIVADANRVQQYVVSFAPADRQQWLRQTMDRMGERMGGWFLGELALMAIIGLASYIALTVIGVQGAILLALLAGLGEAVPVVGPYITAIPAVLVAFVQDPGMALWVIVVYFAIQQVESNILAPLIVGRAVKLHPLAVLFALLAGATLLGIVGAVIAAPITAAIAVLLDEFRHRHHPDREGPQRAGAQP